MTAAKRRSPKPTVTSDDPYGEIDPNTLTYYSDQPIVADDVLVGGAGADTFRFEVLINAKPEKILDHVMDNGMIHWHGVAGENNNVHDHWVDRLGNEVIWDFNRAEGDHIEVDRPHGRRLRNRTYRYQRR